MFRVPDPVVIGCINWFSLHLPRKPTLIHSLFSSTTNTDQELFLQISEGDEQAFVILFNRYVPQLQAYASKLTKSEPIAEELIQEIFLRIWLKRDTLTEVDNPRGWLFRVAANECYSYLRREIVKEKALKTISANLSEGVDSINEHLQLKELKTLIHEAVDQMPPQRKLIYQMSRDRHMKISEIADELKLSVHTVKNVLVTAIKSIRAFLEQREHHLTLILCCLVEF